ncbi:MAG: ammonium transporter [Bacteroidota bacterium]
MAAVDTAQNGLFTANNTWMLVATAMVFIMHLGFSAVESGFVRQKNVVNILFKNAMIISIGLLSYYVIGWGIMYPGDTGNGFFTLPTLFADPGAEGQTVAYTDGAYTYWTDFIFQAMFAATAATIVSGAVAERIKIGSFLLFATLLVALSYPITGMWKWGGGWLDQMGFYDFAGSTLVHACGGAAALVMAFLLGPRKDKYTSTGAIKPIPGHSMPLAAIGVFLLWFGWYGFNGGSVLSADPDLVSLVFTTTSLAAAAGAIGAFIVSSTVYKALDLSMVLNGMLGGLVGITAGADVIPVPSAILVGLIAGAIIPLSVVMFDKIKIDDPVGATSVHLVCGIWGTLAVGIFGQGDFSFGTQLIGTLSVIAFTAVFSFIVGFAIKSTIGLRVSEEEEEEGLDVGEHGMNAYA